jgi:hypothetical protein
LKKDQAYYLTLLNRLADLHDVDESFMISRNRGIKELFREGAPCALPLFSLLKSVGWNLIGQPVKTAVQLSQEVSEAVAIAGTGGVTLATTGQALFDGSRTVYSSLSGASTVFFIGGFAVNMLTVPLGVTFLSLDAWKLIKNKPSKQVLRYQEVLKFLLAHMPEAERQRYENDEKSKEDIDEALLDDDDEDSGAAFATLIAQMDGMVVPQTQDGKNGENDLASSWLKELEEIMKMEDTPSMQKRKHSTCEDAQLVRWQMGHYTEEVGRSEQDLEDEEDCSEIFAEYALELLSTSKDLPSGGGGRILIVPEGKARKGMKFEVGTHRHGRE